MTATLSGHLWTIAPTVLGRGLARIRARATHGQRWHCTVSDDPEVTLTGRLESAPHQRTLCVILHGLGGSANSVYMLRCATACREHDIASLRLSLRGADGRGDDMYHAGLVGDLHQVLDHPLVAAFSRLIVVGYSLGGHVALHLAASDPPPKRKPAAVAAICPPLDLAAASAGFDAGPRWLYRRHVLESLKSSYATIAARGRGWVDPHLVATIDRIRQWDDQVVVPRFGFASTDAYYRQMSAGPRLSRLAVPTLILHSRLDPVVPWSAVAPWRGTSPRACFTDVASGGHCSFAPGTDLRLDPRASRAASVEHQLIRWCLRAG
ncbi:MAG: alpha/beta fold hydrolase [Myxococcales bacterium FL481]|nr:MAG: alpha/beta fold hydrolase [Myxococcales bacterium FL481]